MNYTEQVEKYLEYCEFRKELDWNTLKAYRIDLRQFFEYTMEDIPGKEKIEDYITELHKKFKQKNSVLEALKKASEVCKIKKTEIWVCENQDFYSPMLFGVRNTKVLIPQEMLETENYSYEEWYLIFLHELTHQKKHDLWYKRFLQIIRDVYWFCIPMLWVQKMANIDIEGTPLAL